MQNIDRCIMHMHAGMGNTLPKVSIAEFKVSIDA